MNETNKLKNDKKNEKLNTEEIKETTSKDTTTEKLDNKLDESPEELRAMGIRDISELNLSKALGEVMKNAQIQKTLNAITNRNQVKKSPREYLEEHIKFLANISEGKDEKTIAEKITIEHAKAILKTTAKMDLDDALIKKHLKKIRKKFK